MLRVRSTCVGACPGQLSYKMFLSEFSPGYCFRITCLWVVALLKNFDQILMIVGKILCSRIYDCLKTTFVSEFTIVRKRPLFENLPLFENDLCSRIYHCSKTTFVREFTIVREFLIVRKKHCSRICTEQHRTTQKLLGTWKRKFLNNY